MSRLQLYVINYALFPKVGGATGKIGDPSGRTAERTLLEDQQLETNIRGIRNNLELVLGRFGGKFKILDNYDWFKGFQTLEFLRDVGMIEYSI